MDNLWISLVKRGLHSPLKYAIIPTDEGHCDNSTGKYRNGVRKIVFWGTSEKELENEPRINSRGQGINQKK